MAQDQHKFRYLLPPGSDFKFVSKFRVAMLISTLIMGACIAMLFVNKSRRGEYMNWTIDFRGGTEIIYSFKDKANPTAYKELSPGEVRKVLNAAGEDGFDVSDITWTQTTDKGDVKVSGIVVRTPRFGALDKVAGEKVVKDLLTKLEARKIEKASWSGERLFVRSMKQITAADWATADEVFKTAGLELKPWGADEAAGFAMADPGTGEFNVAFGLAGIERQLAHAIEKAHPEVDATAENSYGVGAKAGDQLRNDAIKSLVFAMLLVMLYLAFRFDIRYAPGAAFATLHDAVIVVGVFAATWTEVSLTTVAALLTVIGYSVNDTVVIFDRIRENAAKMKDKRLERIVDISINETVVRSIMTSLTVFMVTLVMNILGEGLIRNFAFAMNIGVVVGSYSSLYLAPHVFLWIAKTWYSGPATARSSAGDAVAAEP